MADYHATSRSNYFLVQNAADFEAWADELGLDVRQLDGTFAIFAEDWPSTDDGDFIEQLQMHLLPEPGNIAILMSSGHEKQRYIAGFAHALRHPSFEPNFTMISLSDIYTRCDELFGRQPETECEY